MTYQFVSPDIVKRIPMGGLGALGDIERARVLFQQAERQFEAGRFNSAAQNFMAAYREEQHPDALWNVAFSYERAEAFRQALNHYQQYVGIIDSRTWRPTPRNTRAAAQRRVEAMRTAIAAAPAERGPASTEKGPVERVIESVVGVFTKGAEPSATPREPGVPAPQGGKQPAGVAAEAQQVAREEAAAITGESIELPAQGAWYTSPTTLAVVGLTIVGLSGAGFWYLLKERS